MFSLPICVCWPRHITAHTTGLVQDYLLQSMWAMDCTWGSPPLCLQHFPVNCLFRALQNNCLLVPLSPCLSLSLSLSLKEDLLFLYSERFLQLHSFLLRAWVSFIKYVHQVLRQCCFSQQTGGEGWKGCGYTRANAPLQPAASGRPK